VRGVIRFLLLRYLASNSDGTAAKYGLIVAVLSAAIITAALGIASRLTEAGASSYLLH
jgi:Flp pilus assembly pilin Flp